MKKDKSSSRPNKVQVEVTNSNLQEKKKTTPQQNPKSNLKTSESLSLD